MLLRAILPLALLVFAPRAVAAEVMEIAAVGRIAEWRDRLRSAESAPEILGLVDRLLGEEEPPVEVRALSVLRQPKRNAAALGRGLFERAMNCEPRTAVVLVRMLEPLAYPA
ncbi:MAG: hypothetical protein ACREIA_12265, partial [Opitutaceae bacterium]